MDLRSALLAVAAVALSGAVVGATTAGARGGFVDVAPIDLRPAEAPAGVPHAGSSEGGAPVAPAGDGEPPMHPRDGAVDDADAGEQSPFGDVPSAGAEEPIEAASNAGPVRRAPAPAPKPAPKPAPRPVATADDDEEESGTSGGGDAEDREEDEEPDDSRPDDSEPDDEKDFDDADADDRDDVLDD